MLSASQAQSASDAGCVVRFDRRALPAVAWRNGGGLTRELACWPPGAGADCFAWRASIATIAADGPFSRYPGVDRVIVLLDGGGVRLRAHDGSIDHTLAARHVPFTFAGETSIDATCVAGESTDFNLMTRRSDLRAELQVWHEAGATQPVSSGLLYAAAGDWQAEVAGEAGEAWSEALRNGQGFWWHGAARRLHLTPTSPQSVLLLASWAAPNH